MEHLSYLVERLVYKFVITTTETKGNNNMAKKKIVTKNGNDAGNVNAALVSIIVQMGWYGGRAQPVLLVGVPGVAKTRFVEGICGELTKILRDQELINEDEKLEMASYVLPQTSPDALEGISVPSTDRTVLNRLPLADLARVANAKFGLVLGDELSSANPETGAAFMTFASDGRAGDLKIHDRVARVFAMNPASCAAAGRELSPPEANRFCWINWSLPLADYTDYLRGGKGLLSHVTAIPSDWEERFAPRTKLLVALFLEHRRDLLNELDNGSSAEMQTSKAKGVNAHNAWASQRSWENGARVMAACMSTGATQRSELCLAAMTGCVGQTAGQEFFKWLTEANMPDPEDLLANPDKALSMLPTRPDHVRATLEQLALCASDKSVAEAKKQDVLERWATAGKICHEVFKTNKDSAYSACNMLARSLPRQMTDKENAQHMEWAKALYTFRQELGIKDV